jgi:hypothetical protein
MVQMERVHGPIPVAPVVFTGFFTILSLLVFVCFALHSLFNETLLELREAGAELREAGAALKSTKRSFEQLRHAAQQVLTTMEHVEHELDKNLLFDK